MKKSIRNIIRNIRSFEFLNKFLKGVKIIRINPTKLLIKNRGKRNTFVQKSFIFNVNSLLTKYKLKNKVSIQNKNTYYNVLFHVTITTN